MNPQTPVQNAIPIVKSAMEVQGKTASTVLRANSSMSISIASTNVQPAISSWTEQIVQHVLNHVKFVQDLKQKTARLVSNH